MIVTDAVASVPIRTEPLRVLIGGWYGAANLGDELLLVVIARWVREAGGVPIAISNHPTFTAAAHGIEAVGYGDLAAVVEAMATADLFVLGGGGLFQDYDVFDMASLGKFPAYSVSQYAQFLLLAVEMGLPTLALAQGVGPLRAAEGRAIAADVFNRASGVSVRDAASADLLHEIGVTRDVTVAPDPGWTWTNDGDATSGLRERYPELKGRQVIAMVLRDWPFDPEWESACVRALAAAIPADWAMLWLDFHRPPAELLPGFSEIARRMVGNLADARTHVIWDGEGLAQAAGLLAQCDACIAMRLHGVLLAAVAGLPTVVIEYDGKVSALCDEIGIPRAQRVRLQAIQNDLPAAISVVTGPDRALASRLAPERRAGMAHHALVHRELLWRAMADTEPTATSAVAPADAGAQESSWLARWLHHVPDAVPRVVTALTRRLRR